MQPIVFKDRITLEERRQGYGSNPEPKTLKSRTVWGCVTIPSLTSKVNAESIGIKTDLTIHVYRAEYLSGNYTHININDTRYKIESATSSINNLFVKLEVSRV